VCGRASLLLVGTEMASQRASVDARRHNDVIRLLMVLQLMSVCITQVYGMISVLDRRSKLHTVKDKR